jgi:hypothetical protein
VPGLDGKWIGTFDCELAKEFFAAFAAKAEANVHVLLHNRRQTPTTSSSASSRRSRARATPPPSSTRAWPAQCRRPRAPSRHDAHAPADPLARGLWRNTPPPATTGAPPTPVAPVPDAAPALPKIAELSPPGFEGMYLGMPRAAFMAWAERAGRTIVPLPTYPPSALDGPRTTWEENRYDATIGNVRYHFLADGDEPLYLIEIGYQEQQAPYDLVEQTYATFGQLTENAPASTSSSRGTATARSRSGLSVGCTCS